MTDQNISHDHTPGAPVTDLRSSEEPAISATVLEAPPPTPGAVRYRGFDLWLHRITVLMFVFVCAVVGVLLMIFPWRPEWTDNRLLLAYPALRAFVSNGFVRGFCSGLGLLDVWVGFWEAVHYNEVRHP